MRKEPVAIITSGGGMSCAYSAGALTALGEKMGLSTPDIFVSASGSVGAMFYYLAGQHESIRETWTHHLASPAFIRYVPFPKIRIDYLIDTIFRKMVPLEIAKLESSRTEWLVPIIDLQTGHVDFVSKDKALDPYEIMRAAKAIPFLYNNPVHLANRLVMDGDVETDMSDMVHQALIRGAKKILFINNTSPRPAFFQFFMRMSAHLGRRATRPSYVRGLEPEHVFEIPEGVRIVSISPSHRLPAELLTRSRRKLMETFYTGYDDLLAKREEVEKLFED